MQTQIELKKSEFPDRLTVGDAVWVATALLHKENSSRDETGFTTEEIVQKVLDLGITDGLRSSIYLHVNQHCVANRKPNPGRLRYLYELKNKNRRLYRKGDPYDSAREGSRTSPDERDIERGSEELLHWYTCWYNRYFDKSDQFRSLFGLIGSGSTIWADEPSDDYVRRLREGWE